MSKLLESDYDEWLKARETDERIRDEISTIQNSPNPFKTYVQISERYRMMRDMEQEMRFRWATTEVGIPYACPFLGDLYFHGLTVPVDYEKAAELYEKGWDCLTPEQVLNLASIYINQLSSKKSKSEGESIRDLCIPGTRNEISTYTTKEGHTFWSLRRIKSNTQ